MNTAKVAIIGAGPAGISAAIQLKRSGVNPVIFEKGSIGGLLNCAGLIENYPGFPDGIKSVDLIEKMSFHIKRFDIKPLFSEVTEIIKDKEHLLIKSLHDIYKVSHLILCTGTKKVKIDPSIEEKAGDLAFYDVRKLKNMTGKKIVIIGAGDAAFDFSLQLSHSNKVDIYVRSKNIKAIACLKKMVQLDKNINVFMEKELLDIEQNNEKSLNILFNDNSTIADYIVFAIGRTPEISLLKNINTNIERDEKIKIAGTACTEKYRQTGIAIGMGIRAAMEIMEKIN